MKHKLEQADFQVHNFFYPSVRNDVQANTQALCQKIQALDLDQLHIVAHSMGGIMALHLLQQCEHLPKGRIVMLGTPINGSYIAHKVSAWPLVNNLLAKSMPAALDGNFEIPDHSDRDIGMIAGRNDRLGFRLLLGSLPEASDGTVLISETQHPILTDHIIVNENHTGMIFSSHAAALVIHFLENGQFQTSTDACQQ